MSATISTPTVATDITAAWLTDALRAGGTLTADTAVAALETEPVGVGIGLVGALARLRPAYEGGSGPATIVAKFAAPDEGSRFVANVLGMYRREVGFYQELSARTALPHAHCYYAHHDAGTDAFILLLEDLEGGRVVDQLDGCNRDEAAVAIDALADFHAGFWSDSSLTDTDWLGALCDPPLPDAVAMSFDGAWGPVQEMFGQHLTPALKAFGDRYTELLGDLMSRLSAEPTTLSHGDYRLDNIFFATDPAAEVQLRVCDWQLVDRSRGARDLAYFITQSATPELRAEIERPLVERYAARLESHGIADYPVEVVWDDYRLATAFAFAYPVVAGGGLDHADERATQLTGEMFRRSALAITQLESLALI